jgi:GNAT superfamily N-acetyltransferase
MILRRAEAADLPDIIGMALLFHAESPVHGWLEFDPSRVRELVLAAIDDPDWLPLVVYADDELIGMAMMIAVSTFFGNDIEVCDLIFYVDHSRRGSKAALAMMAHIRAWAKQEKGALRLTITPNTGINQDQAVSFFEKCGMQRQGTVLSQRL